MAEILFLGTGAADWDINQRDGFFRRNSAALINDDLMVDCGLHIFDFCECENKKDLYKNVTDIIVTHSHDDHVRAQSVLKLADSQKIRVGCDKQIMDLVGEHPNIEYVQFKPFVPKKMGNYEIIPLLANHQMVADGDSFAFHYIIKTPDKKTLFYGLDGAWFLRPSWQEMKKHKFDVMVFDCTVGDSDDWRLFEHNTIPMLRMMLDGIKEEKLLADGGKLVASHLARTLHTTHEETAKILEKIDTITAYDGMKIEF